MNRIFKCDIFQDANSSLPEGSKGSKNAEFQTNRSLPRLAQTRFVFWCHNFCDCSIAFPKNISPNIRMQTTNTLRKTIRRFAEVMYSHQNHKKFKSIKPGHCFDYVKKNSAKTAQHFSQQWLMIRKKHGKFETREKPPEWFISSNQGNKRTRRHTIVRSRYPTKILICPLILDNANLKVLKPHQQLQKSYHYSTTLQPSCKRKLAWITSAQWLLPSIWPGNSIQSRWHIS